MHKVWNLQRGVVVLLGLTVVLVAAAAGPVRADRMTSSNFILNGNANSSFGGQGSSTSYGMFSTGGEPVIGNGASGSYMLGDGFTAQTQQSIALTVQPGGLLGHWKFDESTGTLFTDSSATRADANKAGTNDGNLTSTTGKLGNAIAGSGANSDSRIVIPAGSIQPSSISVEMWARVNSFGADSKWDSLCSYYASAGQTWGPWELYTDGDNSTASDVDFYWSVQTGSQHPITTQSQNFSLNTWYHLVGTYDAATGVSKLYVNGVERASGTFTAASLNYTVGNSSNQLSCFNSGRFPGQGLQGAVDHVKIFNRALSADEALAEYSAQDAGVPTGISLGSVAPGASNTALQDIIVRTDSGQYGVTISQDHDLQKGAATIPAISPTIASPAAWSEGTTKGLGFTLVSAPGLDSKWGSGANYAAIPASVTSFYTRSGHASSDTIDTISSRLRLDAQASQEAGAYSNTVTYTGTTLP